MSTILKLKVTLNIKVCSTVISAVPDLTSRSKERVIFQYNVSLFPKFCHVVAADWCLKITNFVEK
jgi:hypothetical protein